MCRTNRPFLGSLTFLCIVTSLALAQSPESAPPANSPEPTAQVDLAALGYRIPPLSERTSEDESNVSLNFVDAGHVLLAFNPKKMFQRLPECAAAHHDRIMHAVILDVAGGKVAAQSDWYLHDYRPYLWPFGAGKFLLRRGNQLYLVDANLHEKLLWSSPKDLLWVSVTPPGDQIIVETALDPEPAQKSQATPKPAAPPKFVAQFLDATTLAPQRSVPLNNVVDITGTSTGYVDLVHHGEIWLIRFGPNPKVRHNIARVRSQTDPSVFYGSNNTLQIGWCGTRNCDFSVSSFTLTGRRLWHQRWGRFRIFPAVVRNEDNSRFAVSTLQQRPVSAVPAPAAAENDANDVFQLDPAERDVFQQDIQVFETASGNSVFSLSMTPAIVGGQDFALSPDGRRLAVLHADRLESFDLPAGSSEEQRNYASLKNEVHDLSALASSEDQKSASDEAMAASDSSAGTAKAEQPDAEAEAKSPSPEIHSEDSTAPLMTLKVSTHAVVVDVVVTDSKGHPVKGLPEQDFRLTEDSKPQSVRSFREFTGGEAPAEPAPAPAPKSQPNVFSNVVQAQDQEAATVILFDLLNTPAADQMYARDQLVKFLEAKPKNARFALCTLGSGASNLRLIQGFTPDEALLVSAVKSKKGKPQSPRWEGSRDEAANSVNTVSALAQSGDASGFANLLGALQGMQDIQHVEQTDMRVEITTDSLMQLARYLSAIPGRKNLVWLSESFPVAIGIIESANNKSVDNRNYSEKLRRMTNLLAESQVAVYPVDVRGLVAGGFEAAGSGSLVQGPPVNSSFTAGVLAPTPQTPPGFGELDELVEERNTLSDVASATGGKAFFSVNNIRAAIATAVEQGSNYYTLSYTPTNQVYNGKFRKIKVALAEKQKGYKLHYREGYFAEAEKSSAPDADLARSSRIMAMQHASPPSRQIVFSATVAPLGKKRKMDQVQIGEVIPVSTKKSVLPPMVDVQHYGIDYTFDGSAVHFAPQKNGAYQSVLTLMAASFDSSGTMLTGMSHLAVSAVQPSVYKAASSGKLVLHEEANVPVQAAWLRLGIQDLMSGHIGTIEIPLPVPALPGAQQHSKPKLPEIEKD